LQLLPVISASTEPVQQWPQHITCQLIQELPSFESVSGNSDSQELPHLFRPAPYSASHLTRCRRDGDEFPSAKPEAILFSSFDNPYPSLISGDGMDAVQIPDKLVNGVGTKSEATSVPLPSLLELTTKSSASILIVTYGLGFVILGFHDAKYGVVQFSPFRARILLVGFVFAMLVALAAAAFHYRFAYIAPLESVVKDSAPERRRERDTVLAAGFVFTASLMTTLIGLFVFNIPPNQFNKWRFLWWLVAYAMVLGIFHFVNKTFSAHPNRAVLISIFASTAFTGITSYTNYEAYGALFSVFAAVGWHSLWMRREGGPLKFTLDFRNLLYMLFIVWVYISSVFSYIPPRWGGGQPTPIVIFQNTQALWSPSNPMDALMLDETDQGFYVLLAPTGKAFFMPRGNVSTVFFGTKEELTKK
jgi:hypothetical protein